MNGSLCRNAPNLSPAVIEGDSGEHAVENEAVYVR
jgi:hypothetical protein